MNEYVSKINEIYIKWSAPNLITWRDYFYGQWIYSNFNAWQFFHSPAGIATTNSCIESFNRIIKYVYTDYELYSVAMFLKIVIEKMINTYTVAPKEFKYYREPSIDMIEMANKIIDSNINFIQSNQNPQLYVFDGPESKYNMFVGDNHVYNTYKFISCTCLSFHASYVCKHSVALAIRLKYRLMGFIPISDEKFVIKKKPGKQKASSALEKGKEDGGEDRIVRKYKKTSKTKAKKRY